MNQNEEVHSNQNKLSNYYSTYTNKRINLFNSQHKISYFQEYYQLNNNN